MLMYLRRDKRYIKPRFWGKVFWDYMFHYANNANFMKRNPFEHFKTLSFFIPCHACQVEFCKKLKKSRSRLKSMHNNKNSLLHWVWKYKNEVNMRLGKKQIPFEEAMNKQFGSAKKEYKTFTKFFDTLYLTLPTANPAVPAKYKHLKSTVCKKTAELFSDIITMLRNRRFVESVRTNHQSRIVPS